MLVKIEAAALSAGGSAAIIPVDPMSAMSGATTTPAETRKIERCALAVLSVRSPIARVIPFAIISLKTKMTRNLPIF